MASVLVVDDSEVDRRLVGGLLATRSDLSIRFAENGADALKQVDQDIPDLIVTDLIMPEVDGLELVETVRVSSPGVPVVIVTSQGNEEIAVKALLAGAASYVPKRMLSDFLCATVERLLETAMQGKIRRRLLGSMDGIQCSFTLENDLDLISPLVSYIQETVNHVGTCDETESTRLGVALDEALQNSLGHGNLEVSSELRSTSDAKYIAAIKSRMNEPPYRDRRIFVEVQVARDLARFVIRDEGPGFDPSSLPDPTDPTNLTQLTGRGVFLMRAFMDEVTFNESGNCVTMVKRLGSDRA